MGKPVYMVSGSKGGVGKSIVSMSLIHYLSKRDEKLLLMTSIMHASGLFFQMVPAVEQGLTIILIASFDAGVVLDELERHGATISAGLPAMVQFVVAEQEERPRNVRSLRLAYGGAIVCRWRCKRAFRRPSGYRCWRSTA